jgi:hypothetical protein
MCTAFSDHTMDQVVKRLGVTDRLLILKKPFDEIEAAQLANALTVKWEMAKMLEFNLLQMETTIEEQRRELQITLDKPQC